MCSGAEGTALQCGFPPAPSPRVEHGGAWLQPGFLTGLCPSAARNALVVSGAALMAYSCDVAGHRPFVLTGEVVQGLPAVRAPPFSLTTANRTVSFTQMVQVGKGGSRARLPGLQGPGSVPRRPPGGCPVLGKGCLGAGTGGGIPDRAQPRASHLLFCLLHTVAGVLRPHLACASSQPCSRASVPAGGLVSALASQSGVPRCPAPQAKPHETETTKR